MTSAATTITAVIFVPADQFDTYASRCAEHCKAKGYQIYGVITDDWADAAELLESGKVDRIVVGRRDHIDPHHLPGVEVAAVEHVAVDRPDRPDRSSRRRRPRIV